MKALLTTLTLASAATAIGCDNPFGYSYLTETLKPGKVEIVQWVTGRASADDVSRSIDMAVRLLLGSLPFIGLGFALAAISIVGPAKGLTSVSLLLPLLILSLPLAETAWGIVVGGVGGTETETAAIAQHPGFDADLEVAEARRQQAEHEQRIAAIPASKSGWLPFTV